MQRRDLLGASAALTLPLNAQSTARETLRLAFDFAETGFEPPRVCDNVAYIVAHRLRGYDTLVMEVNPRHVRYCGRRVIDFDYIRQQIGEFAGAHHAPNAEVALTAAARRRGRNPPRQT